MDQPPMKLRQRKNYIPKDVVLNILTRRVKSLVRFRSVSKSLNHSITTPDFVSTQFKFHIYDSFPFLLYTTYTSSGHICCVISQSTHRIPRNILNYNWLVLVMELYVLIGIWMAKRISFLEPLEDWRRSTIVPQSQPTQKKLLQLNLHLIVKPMTLIFLSFCFNLRHPTPSRMRLSN